MNKTVNINLGGMFFHIDEDAYQKLTRYFEAIKRSLSNSSGQDEIIKDIEMRIGELIAEKHSNDKQVINLKEIDEVIAIMGQPEDYRLEDDASSEPTGTFDYAPKRSKKLYRDTEKGMIGGVATGLGHYFGIDAVWLKIMFAIFAIVGFGAGIIAYFVLWIVMPAAMTTSEKLEMTGEPVTISNIEKKVREEFENVSEKFKNANYDKMGNQVKSGADRLAGNIGDVFMTIFKVFAKVLGAILVVVAAATLVSLIVGFFTLGSTSLVDVPWQNHIDSVNHTNMPLWIIGLLFFLAVGIPFFFLFILGLKLLVNNLKSIGSIAKYTLLALWLIAVAILITLGIKQATEVAFDGKSVVKETINITPNDTLKIKFKFNDYYAKDLYRHNEYIFTQDEKNQDQIYSNEVYFHILKTDEKLPYIQIEKQAEGKSISEAKKRAEAIKYSYTIQGNTIVLDNYLLTETIHKYRSQQIQIFLYLPEGTYVKPDRSVQEFDDSDNEFFNLHFDGDYLYRVDKSQVKCLDCPIDDNEYGDVEGAAPPEGADFAEGYDPTADTIATTVTVGRNGLRIISNEVDENTKKVKVNQLYINKDGIVTKKQ